MSAFRSQTTKQPLDEQSMLQVDLTTLLVCPSSKIHAYFIDYISPGADFSLIWQEFLHNPVTIHKLPNLKQLNQVLKDTLG